MKQSIINVVAELAHMLYNNVIDDNGLETFEGWCENGVVFEDNDTREEDIKVMKELAPIIDELTEKIHELNNK